MFAAQPFTTFCEATAAAEPTPGGGAVAAALGALGSAVGAMAARYSEDAEAEPATAANVKAQIEALDEVRRRLIRLLDDDIEAYAGVRAAYALPRAEPEQKATRKAVIQDALAGAAEPPLRICRAALEGLAALDALIGDANPHLLSDIGVAAHALGAAQQSAWLNVLVNLRLMKRAELVEGLRAEGEPLLQRGAALHARLAARVRSTLES